MKRHTRVYSAFSLKNKQKWSEGRERKSIKVLSFLLGLFEVFPVEKWL